MRNTALELLSTYRILVCSYVGELGIQFSRKLQAFLKVPPVPSRVGLVLSPMSEVICFGQWAQVTIDKAMGGQTMAK